MKWTRRGWTQMTPQRPAFCKSTVICRTAQMLVLLLVASLGAEWLSPTLAHSQTTAEWNQAWCKAIGNCSSFFRFYHWRVSSPGAFRAAVNSSDIRMAQPSSNPRFAFERYRAFGIRGESLRQYVQLGFPSAVSRPAAPTITNDIWTGGPGDWSNASMWTAGLPNTSDNALIDNGNSKNSPVTLDINAAINNLAITTGDSLSFNPGTSLTVDGGTISNAGTIAINSASDANALLVLGANTTLKGSGTMTLSTVLNNGGQAYIEGNGFTLTNAGSVIQGDGIIGNGSLAIVNESGGVIDANSAGGSAQVGLYLNGSGNITNAGLLEATNSGILVISNAVNNAGGNITANGSSAAVEMSNADIQGGTLNTLNGGTIETVPGEPTTLDGSTKGALTLSASSTYTGPTNTQTNILGAINNNGNFQFNSSNDANSILNLTGDTTLQGGGKGTVTLSTVLNNGGYAYIEGNGFTLTNTNNIIQGDGIIGNGSLAIVNESGGVIDANSAGGSAQVGLYLNGSGNITNAGLLEATNSGILVISNAVNNAGGNITANGSSAAVEMSNADIQGGTLNTLNGGTIETVPGEPTTLDGSTKGALTLSASSTYTGPTNTQTNILGAINNNGNFQFNSSNDANSILNLTGDTTLQGGGKGTVTLSTVLNNGGYAYIEGNGFTLTNTNNIIQGDGIIGNGNMALVNQSGGIIDANAIASSGDQLQLNLNGSGNVINSGLLEATNNGILVISNTVNNKAGNITANGSAAVVQLVEADIQGGTLNTVNGGTMGIPTGYSATLDGSTSAGALTLSSGSTYTGQTNTVTNVLGTIDNNGSFQFNSSSDANAFLNLGANTTLQGGGKGTVILNTAAANGGYAYIQGNGFTLTNTNNIIEGDGIIGNGSLALVNQSGAVIDANSAGGSAQLQLYLNGSGGITNTGLLEATNSGILVISTAVNNKGGNITANGSSAAVEMANAGIQGGTLNTLNGGTLETVPGNPTTLDGSTNGALTLSAGSTYTGLTNTDTNILGAINNNGNFQFNSSNDANSILNLTANTTLQGGGKGTVTLSTVPANGGQAYIQGNGFTLTNTNNTIQGDGIIGNGSLSLINNLGGTLYANVSGQTLLINGSGKITNNGTMKVASGATMHVTNGAFTNFAGTTLTGGTYNVAGTLEIDELGNAGGEIVTNAASIILNGTTSSFIDGGGQNALSELATNAKGARFTITGGRNFATAGKFTNNGTLTVGSANSTFTVSGNLTNFSTSTLTLTGGTYNLAGTLKFKGADIVTNAANITLSGSSSKVVDQHGNNGLANLATNNGSFTINNGRNFTTAGAFTNNGTLAVGSGNSTFGVNGNLTNFSGTTLTGGTYNLTGTLQFNGANIVTSAANITLTGTSSQIIDQHSNNGLANFATNNGSFALAGGRSFTTAGNFINAGTFTVNTGSSFALGASGMYTQSAGTTTDNGSLSAPGAVNLQGGSLFGSGSITGNVQSSATVTPGDSSTLTGILTDTGTYTQKSKGDLDISIGGTTAGSKFDELNSTNASLNGTLNIGLVSGYVPTIGNTFKIMNFTSETGTFSTVNGLNINSKEHFKITYQGTDVLLTVVSGALPTGQPINSHFFPGATHQPAIFGRFQMGMFSDLWFRGQSPDIPGRVSTLFHPGFALAKAGFMAAPNRFGFSTNFRVLSTASSFHSFMEALPRRANLGDPQFQVSAAPATLRSSVFRQALVTSPLRLTSNPVNFAALRNGNPGDSFGAAFAGTSVGASSSAPGMVFRSSQFQSVSRSLGRAANSAGSGLLGVNPSLPSATRWGSGNVPTTRTNSGGMQALHGGSAMRSFSVSLSNVMTKPKVGFAIQ